MRAECVKLFPRVAFMYSERGKVFLTFALFFGRMMELLTFCDMLREKKGIWLDYKREELMVKNWGCVE